MAPSSILRAGVCLKTGRACRIQTLGTRKFGFQEQGFEMQTKTLTGGKEEGTLYKATSQSDSIAGLNDAIVEMHHPARKVVKSRTVQDSLFITLTLHIAQRSLDVPTAD
jgi:hypothetical protein